MPHFIVEYSADVTTHHDMQNLCQALFDSAKDSGAFPDTNAIKVRATPATHWVLGHGDSGFVHVTIRLLAGRDSATQALVTQTALKTLKAHLPLVGSLSVDIKDINPATYAKHTR